MGETLLSVCVLVKFFNQKCPNTGQRTVMIGRHMVVFKRSVLPIYAVVGGYTHMKEILLERLSTNT